MYDGELGVGIPLAGIMQKRFAQIGGGDRSVRNHGTSANKSSQADSRRRLNELAVKIAVGILFQNGTTHIQNDAVYDPAEC